MFLIYHIPFQILKCYNFPVLCEVLWRHHIWSILNSKIFLLNDIIYIFQYVVSQNVKQSSIWRFIRLSFRIQMAKICLSLFNSLLFAKEVSYMCIVNTILFSLFFFQPYRHIFFSFKVLEFITKSWKISFFFFWTSNS